MNTEEHDDRPGDAHSGLDARLAQELRTPRAAAIAGIVFGLILIAVTVLLHLAIPPGQAPSGWITDDSRRQKVRLALELVPFAGIAFLWFIGVIRSRLGVREDKLFATVFLGSGLLFIAMLFSSAAAIGGLLVVYEDVESIPTYDVAIVSAMSTALLATFGIRMAAVFTLVVTNLGRRTGIVPRWLQVVGYGAALILFVAPPRTFWAVLLFPTWVLLLSLHFLFASRRPERAGVPADRET